MNPWPVYDFMKSTWIRTGAIPTEKEVRLRLPDRTAEEITEGMMEFGLAYRDHFSKWSFVLGRNNNDDVDLFEKLYA